MMQRPRLRKTRGAAAAAELELWASEEEDDGSRRVTKGLWAGPIYKGRLVNGARNEEAEDMIILPQKRLDSRDGH